MKAENYCWKSGNLNLFPCTSAFLGGKRSLYFQRSEALKSTRGFTYLGCEGNPTHVLNACLGLFYYY